MVQMENIRRILTARGPERGRGRAPLLRKLTFEVFLAQKKLLASSP